MHLASSIRSQFHPKVSPELLQAGDDLDSTGHAFFTDLYTMIDTLPLPYKPGAWSEFLPGCVNRAARRTNLASMPIEKSPFLVDLHEADTHQTITLSC